MNERQDKMRVTIFTRNYRITAQSAQKYANDPKLFDKFVKDEDEKGRRAAVEILIGSSALANMIREAKFSQIDSLIQTGSTFGMQSMDQHLKQLIEEGEITREAAYEKAIDKNLFA